MKIIVPSTPLKIKPDEDLPLETECLFGEEIIILDKYLDWVYCELLTDNYQGWIKKSSLGYFDPPTHRVLNIRTLLFTQRDIKSYFIDYIPMGSKLSVKNISNEWAEVNLSKSYKQGKAYVLKKDIIRLENTTDDWVKYAEQLLGTPYKWGGRDTMGIDCSALLQLSYQLYGQNIPRNSKEQMKLNKPIIKSIKQLERAHVIFWNGHVGIMTDPFNCIHANAFHFETKTEPLENIIKRMEENNKILKMMNFNNREVKS